MCSEQPRRVRRVCLVTSTQPSSNPRAVKEADALAEAGYDVHLIGAHRAEWASASDARLLASRSWKATVVDWRRDVDPWLFWKSRVRHRAARACMKVPGVIDRCLPAAAGRLTPELTRLAVNTPADLYIAHNCGGLPAAAAAARAHGALLGFDAEDFHSGEFSAADRSTYRVAVEQTESQFIPICDYLTAASPGIADAYAPLVRGRHPVCIFNVFPLACRPDTRPVGHVGGPVTLYWFSQTIGPQRGLEDVVRAMGTLNDGDVELHLRGTWWPGYRDAFMAVAAACGVAPTRVVSHEAGHPDDMVRLAARFDIGLALEPGRSPNNDIALSNKIFTYLLAGCAVIGTTTAGQRGLLAGNPAAARGYAPGDVAGLRAVLGEWAGDREALAAARCAAWELGEKRYNWDCEKRTFLNVVSEVFEESAAGRRGSAA